MFTKLGLVLLIMLFGACTFVAGTMAPSAWRSPIAAFGERLFGAAHEPVAAAPEQAGDKLAAPGVGATGPQEAPAAPAASGTAGPVRLDSLLVTAAIIGVTREFHGLSPTPEGTWGNLVWVGDDLRMLSVVVQAARYRGPSDERGRDRARARH